jgi:alkyl sulfatase BDS1-like metallo-beta-lactamase superfamily hydrolase
MTTQMLLELLAVRLDGPAAGDRSVELTLHVRPDGHHEEETWAVGLRHGALHHVAGRPARDPACTLSLHHQSLVDLATGAATLDDLIEAGRASVVGDLTVVHDLFGLLDTFRMGFPLVTP